MKRENMKFRAAMFDLDGTLLDTIEGISRVLNKALNEMGFDGHSLDEYRSIVGSGISNLIHDALPEGYRDEITVKKCLASVIAHYDKYYDIGTKIYPGISRMLVDLKNMGFKLAVLSNRPNKYTRQLVQKYFPEGLFDFVTGEVTGIPRKPDPTSALSIAERLQVVPQEIVYLGDTDIDMITAKNSGMFGVGALWGFRDGVELSRHGAKLLLHYPKELVDFIKSSEEQV